MLVLLAWRNLRRNRRRTLITGAAIALGLALTILTINVAQGSYEAMIREAVSTMAGHVVVRSPEAGRDPEAVVTGADEVAAALRETFPDATVVQRLVTGGLLSSTAGGTAVSLTGVEPAEEARVSDWDDRLVAGRWLEPGDERGIVLGRKMAETLQVEVGDRVVLTGQGAEGMTDRLFRVRGIFRTGADTIDGFVALASLRATRDFLQRPDAASQVAVHLRSASRWEEATRRAKAVLAHRADLAVLSWQEAVPEVWDLVRTDRRNNHVAMGIIGFMVALGVLNTVLMSVLERTREFGVMAALGMKRRRLAGLIVIEGLLLGVVGSIAGFGLGCLFTWPMVTYGLDYGAFMGGADAMEMGGVVMDSVIHATWAWRYMFSYSGAAIVFTVLATLHPARIVSRLKPVEAMHHA